MSHNRPTLIVIGLLAAGLQLAARPAQAASITNFYAFSGSITDAMAVQPFNAALGTLNSIDVNITGVLTVNGATGQNVVQVGPGVFTPVPYGYQVTVTQDFFGLGGRYFDFEGNANFTFTGAATGVGEAFAFQTNYGYDFTFNAGSDLIGFVVPSTSTSVGTLMPPLSGVSGQRSDFLQTMVPLNEIHFIQTWSAQNQSGSALPTVIGNVNTTGQLQITYNYTPVPEPASWMLIVVGAAALAATARRRRTTVTRRHGGETHTDPDAAISLTR